MGTPIIRSKKINRLFDLLVFQWISDTGRFLLRVLSFGKLSLPKTNSQAYEDKLEKCKGFGGRLWLTVRYILIDYIYFPIGLVLWCALILVMLFVFAKLVGPIPPVHEWR